MFSRRSWLHRLSLLVAQTSFQAEIDSILAKSQVCHHGKNQSSGLDLTLRATLVKGGNGEPRLGWILKSVRHEGDLKKPPGGKLTPERVRKLERWVRSYLKAGIEASKRALATRPEAADSARSVWAIMRGSQIYS